MGQRLTKQMLNLLTIECSENKMVQHVHIDYALLHVWVELLKYEKDLISVPVTLAMSY